MFDAAAHDALARFCRSTALLHAWQRRADGFGDLARDFVSAVQAIDDRYVVPMEDNR